MNKEEILTMEAGEELDRLVATEVMGEPMPAFIPESALEFQLAGSPVKSPKGNWVCLCRYDEGDIPTWRPLTCSTDISAAWKVVKKMINDGNSYFSDYGDNEKWGVTYAHSIGELVWADTIEEAICKAALLTKLNKK